jgi:small toxic polypeptide LdrA/B/C/D
MTYLLLNAVFMITAFAAIFLLGHGQIRPKNLIITLSVMLALTAIFDTAIIATGIVAYDETKILGLYIFRAPVEDFGYAVIAAFLAPMLWRYYDKK